MSSHMPNQPGTSPTALEGLTNLLNLEQLETNIFRGVSPQDGWQRVYGGQVLGQALSAAIRTVEPDRHIHSLHAYFLIGGDPTNAIVYEVEELRNGGSFTTRRVKAIQHGKAIFFMGASFHKAETSYDHQSSMPDVPAPEDLQPAQDLMRPFLEKLPKNMRKYWESELPIEFRPVNIDRYLTRQKAEPTQYVWLKTNGQVPDDPHVHQCLLAYASDFTLLDTSLIAHGKLLFDPDIQVASLDHAMWLHRPFRADEWLLYAQDSPTSFGARALCRGTIFDRNGKLVASTAQEGLLRKRTRQ